MLEVRNLTKVYKPKKGKDVTALNNVSIQFETTGMVFVLGKSGSGKSTFLNLMGGLDSATSGEVVIKGKSSKDFTQGNFDSYRNTYLGFIFQEYNILDEFTVGQNIGLALELQGRRRDQHAIDEILKEVDLEGYSNRKPHELSGGQKQRIAIARALVKNPDIIMADEPTGALDSNTGAQVFETLQKLSKTKLVVIVSHDREYAEYYGDRVIEFKDGKVISDIYKYKAPGKVLADGNMSIIDDKIITIKKGHKLSTKEKDTVIKFLENASGDLIISSDAHANNDFQKSARIDSEGNKESFKDTKNSELNLQKYTEQDFNLKRSRLPLRHAFRIGASGLRGKPIRLIFTLLLCTVAFGLFGIADTAASYDKIIATYESMRETGSDTIALSKVEEKPQDGWISRTNMSMSTADLAELNDKFDNVFSPLYNTSYKSFYNNISGSDALSSYGYYITSFESYVLSSKTELESMGYTVTGTYPTASNQIAISEHTAETFMDAKYQDTSVYPYDVISINQASQLIGKKLDLNGITYTITAIIDTNFDTQRYESIKNMTGYGNTTLADYTLMQELQTISKYGHHATVFVTQGFDALSPDATSFTSVPMIYYSFEESPSYMQSFNGVAIYNDSLPVDITVLDNSIKNAKDEITLAPNEVIVADNIYSGTEPTTIYLQINQKWKELRVVGTYDWNGYYNGAIFGTDILATTDNIFCVVAKLPSNRSTALELIRFSYETNDSIRFEMQSMVSSTLDQVNSMIETFASVFLYIGIGFAVFAALMLMNFIAVSINHKRKEIGILRAIGARSSDVFKIFFSESFILTVINVILAIIGVIVACIFINQAIIAQGILMSLMNVGIRQILLIFVVGIATAIIASFLPVWRIARKKPVEAIKR